MISFRNIITTAGIIFLSVHFLAIGIYTVDGSFIHRKFYSIARWYVFPHFAQKWNVFGPEPPQWEIYLFYRCTFNDGTKSKWMDPGAKWLMAHQNNRIGYSRSLYKVYNVIARGLYNIHYSFANSPYTIALSPQQKISELNRLISASEPYLYAVDFLNDEAKKTFPLQTADSIEMVYVSVHPVPFNERNYPEAKKKYGYIRFPIADVK